MPQGVTQPSGKHPWHEFLGLTQSFVTSLHRLTEELPVLGGALNVLVKCLETYETWEHNTTDAKDLSLRLIRITNHVLTNFNNKKNEGGVVPCEFVAALAETLKSGAACIQDWTAAGFFKRLLRLQQAGNNFRSIHSRLDRILVEVNTVLHLQHHDSQLCFQRSQQKTQKELSNVMAILSRELHENKKDAMQELLLIARAQAEMTTEFMNAWKVHNPAAAAEAQKVLERSVKDLCDEVRLCIHAHFGHESNHLAPLLNNKGALQVDLIAVFVDLPAQPDPQNKDNSIFGLFSSSKSVGNLSQAADATIQPEEDLAPLDTIPARGDRTASPPAPSNVPLLETLLHMHNGGNVLLHGSPGQGKSTVTRTLASCLAAVFLGANDEDSSISSTNRLHNLPAKLGVPFPPSSPELVRRVPFRVQLADFDRQMQLHPSGSNYDVLSHLHSVFFADRNVITSRDLHFYLINHPCCFLFDGLDEVPPERRDIVTMRIKEFLQDEECRCSNSQRHLVVVATRPLTGTTTNAELRHFLPTTFKLVDIDPAAAKRMMIKLVSAMEDREYIGKDSAKRLKQQVAAACESPSPSVQHLLRNPLQTHMALSLLSDKPDWERFDTNRWDLFHKFICGFFDRQMKRTEWTGATVKANRDTLLRFHAEAAFAMQAQGTGQMPTAEFDQRLKRCKLLDEEVDKQDLVGTQIGLLAKRMSDEYLSFSLRPLQEFLAACHVVTQCEQAEQASAFLASLFLRPTTMQETLSFLVDATISEDNTLFVFATKGYLRKAVDGALGALNELADIKFGSGTALAILQQLGETIEVMGGELPNNKDFVHDVAKHLLPGLVTGMLPYRQKSAMCSAVEALKACQVPANFLDRHMPSLRRALQCNMTSTWHFFFECLAHDNLFGVEDTLAMFSQDLLRKGVHNEWHFLSTTMSCCGLFQRLMTRLAPDGRGLAKVAPDVCSLSPASSLLRVVVQLAWLNPRCLRHLRANLRDPGIVCSVPTFAILPFLLNEVTPRKERRELRDAIAEHRKKEKGAKQSAWERLAKSFHRWKIHGHPHFSNVKAAPQLVKSIEDLKSFAVVPDPALLEHEERLLASVASDLTNFLDGRMDCCPLMAQRLFVKVQQLLPATTSSLISPLGLGALWKPEREASQLPSALLLPDRMELWEPHQLQGWFHSLGLFWPQLAAVWETHPDTTCGKFLQHASRDDLQRCIASKGGLDNIVLDIVVEQRDAFVASHVRTPSKEHETFMDWLEEAIGEVPFKAYVLQTAKAQLVEEGLSTEDIVREMFKTDHPRKLRDWQQRRRGKKIDGPWV